VDFFNTRLRIDPLERIEEVESTPSRLEANAPRQQTCQDAECQAVVTRFRGLFMGADGRPSRPADRESKEWQSALEAVLSDLKKWAGDRSTPEVFRNKAILYGDLLNLAPPGAARNTVLHAELEFLQAAKDGEGNRIEWFLPLNTLLAHTVLDPAGYGAFAAELRKSSDPVVSVFARLEAVAPRSADRLMSLL